MSWTRFVIRRFFLTFITLFIVSLVIFGITAIIPGDIVQIILGQEATPENVAALRVQMGLDRPPAVRYLEWIGNAVRGDLGKSLYYDRPIAPLLWTRLLSSLRLAGLAFAVGIPLALLLGIIAGLMPRRLPDHIISIGTLTALSVPEFVSGIALIYIFSVSLGWLPPSSVTPSNASLLDTAKALILPIATLTLVMLAHISRMTRTGLMETMETPYVRTAFLKGLPYRTVVLKHALRNSLLPTITVIAGYLTWLVGGLIIVETLFGYPGIGRLLILAIENRDVPLLQSVALTVASVRILANFGADVLYAYLNPRIRY